MRPFRARFTPPAESIAAGGATAAVILCDLFQRAGGAHAEELGCSIADLQRQGLTWVLLRLDLEIERRAEWRSPLRIATWPSGSRGVFALRDFLARTAAGPLARATSTWCVIDLASRRPVRLPAAIRSIVPPDRPRALGRRFPRPPRPQQPQHRRQITVADDDLDVNRHVNHVRYIEWALGTLPRSWRHDRRLSSLEVEFLAETGTGARLRSEAEETAADGQPPAVLHRLVDGTEREVARLRSRW